MLELDLMTAKQRAYVALTALVNEVIAVHLRSGDLRAHQNAASLQARIMATVDAILDASKEDILTGPEPVKPEWKPPEPKPPKKCGS